MTVDDIDDRVVAHVEVGGATSPPPQLVVNMKFWVKPNIKEKRPNFFFGCAPC